MAKHKKICPQNTAKLDDIDKIIFKLAKVKYSTPYKTKQKIKNTINNIFFNKK